MKTVSDIFRTFAVIMLVAIAQSVSAQTTTVTVTASDLINKVYGLVSPELGVAAMQSEVASAIELTPELDEGNLWLDGDNGYELSYSDIAPEVTAVACFEKDSLTNYAYFFFFPYDGSSRDCVNEMQARFCGSLLQELYDMGLRMGRDVNSGGEDGELFNATCANGLSLVDITLRENTTDEGGSFVLTLNVSPKGLSDDNIVWACN